MRSLKVKTLLFFLISSFLPPLFNSVSSSPIEIGNVNEQINLSDEKINENYYLLDSGDLINIYIPSPVRNIY